MNISIKNPFIKYINVFWVSSVDCMVILIVKNMLIPIKIGSTATAPPYKGISKGSAKR